ncbi:hypothetical protein E3P86_03936 [Wallemia ichthyophaga]|uniref:Uncharacterized protein n=1 Tax=Wallemia ichthyophaga TaxID=245174 RepID=A0A4T0IGE3_WALIC|nr:hypothetical protein E3P86_03936 [Wallemia ichthyophaga]
MLYLNLATHQPTFNNRPAMMQSTQKPSKTLTLTLDAWESKSPLSTTANKSLSVLSNASAEYERPLPIKLSLNKSQISKSATPNLNTPFEVPGTPQNEHNQTQNEIITTPQQYLEWFEQIEKSIDNEHESKYQNHLQKLNSELQVHEDILNKVSLLEDEISSLRDNWDAIDTGTASLKDACQRYLDERDDLIALKEKMQEQQQQKQQKQKQ